MRKKKEGIVAVRSKKDSNYAKYDRNGQDHYISCSSTSESSKTTKSGNVAKCLKNIAMKIIAFFPFAYRTIMFHNGKQCEFLLVQ